MRQIERFYTKNGLPIDEDPAYDYPNRYEVANFPVEEKDINGEGESLKLNMGREPRFYAWIAFHNAIMRYREKMIEKSFHMRQNGKGEKIRSISNWYNL